MSCLLNEDDTRKLPTVKSLGDNEMSACSLNSKYEINQLTHLG